VTQRGTKNKHHKNTCVKEIKPCLQILSTTPYSIMNTIDLTHIFSRGINKRALPITITK
jgi:hypothetical protein